MYKEGDMALVEKLHHLFEPIWNKGKVPQDLKVASIIHLYKRKGNREACDNHSEIFLLSSKGTVNAGSTQLSHQTPWE